jgi:hypothetical protein
MEQYELDDAPSAARVEGHTTTPLVWAHEAKVSTQRAVHSTPREGAAGTVSGDPARRTDAAHGNPGWLPVDQIPSKGHAVLVASANSIPPVAR